MSLWYLLAALVLLIANGFFVGAEFALTAARRTKIEQLATGGSRLAGITLASMRELSFMLAGAQLGITMASLGLGYVAEPAVARGIEVALARVAELPPGLAHGVSFTLALLIVVYLHMVIGEMAPKNIAIAQPERSALWMAVPFRLYANLLRPVIRMLNAAANGVLRLAGVEPRDALEVAHSADDIATMLEASRRAGAIEEFEHRLLSGALRFGDLAVGSVMVPRTAVVGAPAEASTASLERLAMERGVSRIPIYLTDLDDVAGFVHVKDLLAVPEARRDRPLDPSLMRPLLVVPESTRVARLLATMRGERSHLALVIDEYGGMAGIITLDDLLEELVGEIHDEYDSEEGRVRRVGPGRFLVPGSMRPSRLEEPPILLRLPEGDYETIGGFIMERLGRIPEAGDRIHHERWVLRVRRMESLRVAEVELRRH